MNATVRRYMKEKRPVYVRWKGNWYSGEVVRCGPAYVYKVRIVTKLYILLYAQLLATVHNISSVQLLRWSVVNNTMFSCVIKI